MAEDKRRKKAVIFDMDGVISDTEWIYVEKVLQVLAEEGVFISGDDIHDVFGTNMEYICSELKKRYSLERSVREMKERVHYLRDRHYEEKGIKPVEGSDKLLVSQIDIGAKTVQVVSGIAKHYSPDEFVGKTVAVITNLKPVKLRGVLSEGMVLAASGKKGLAVLTLDRDMPAGTKIS